MQDLTKEIQLLKEKVVELESKLQTSNFNMFGRSYSNIGSSDTDFLIKTKGQVKIQWGNKFIDLIKNGKINVDSKFIFTQDEVGSENGIYIVDGNVTLVSDGNQIELTSEQGTSYVSFLDKQDTTYEHKHTALQNIGFLYNDISDITENSLKNGIIYVENEQKLFIVNDGILTEFSAQIPNPYNKQFVISKEDAEIGSLLIKGEGKENSLAFDQLYIYSNIDGSYIDSEDNIYIMINDTQKILIGKNETIFSTPIISQRFESVNATNTQGFKLYCEGNESTLEVDNLIVRNNIDSFTIFPQQWYYLNNIISNIEYQENQCVLSLIFKNYFQKDDHIGIYINIEGELTLIPFIIQSVEEQNIIVTTESPISTHLNQFQKATCFLTYRKDTYIPKVSDKGFDIIFEPNDIKCRIGNLTDLNLVDSKDQKIEGSGIYTNCGCFLESKYIKDYDLPDDDESSKFASTEWVKKSLKSAITDIVNTDLDLYYPYKDTNDYSILQWMNNIGLSEYLLQLDLGTSVISCKHGQLTVEKISETNYKIVAWASAITDDNTISHRSFEFTWNGSNYIYGISTYILFTRYPGYYLSTDKVGNAPQNFYYIGTNKQEVNEVYQYLWNWDGISWQLLDVYMTDDTQYLYIKSTSYSTFILRSVNKYYYVPSGFICYINANGEEVEQGYGKSNYLPVEICYDDDTSIISKLTTLKSFIKSESYNKKPVNENYICLWRIKKEYNRIDYTKWEMLTGYTRQYKLDTEGINLLNCNSPTPEDFKYYKVDSNNKITEEITTMPVDRGTTDNWKNQNWVNTFLIYSISEFLSKNIKYYNPLTGWSFQWDTAYVSSIGGHYGIYFGTPIDPIDDTDNKFPTQSVYQYSGRLIGYGYSVDYYFEGVRIGKKLEGVAGAQNRSIGDVATYLNPLFDIKYTQFYAKVFDLLNKTDEFITIKGNI